MKVVLSADALDKGRYSRQWCIGHLGPGDTVVAVAGLPAFTGYVLGAPLVDHVETEHELLIQTDREYCEPIRAIGAACDARIERRASGIGWAHRPAAPTAARHSRARGPGPAHDR